MKPSSLVDTRVIYCGDNIDLTDHDALGYKKTARREAGP